VWELYILFFLIGLLQDICGASWVFHTGRKSYVAAFWALMWAFCNCTFVLTLAQSLNWYLIPFYALGIASGTTIVLYYAKKGVDCDELYKRSIISQLTHMQRGLISLEQRYAHLKDKSSKSKRNRLQRR